MPENSSGRNAGKRGKKQQQNTKNHTKIRLLSRPFSFEPFGIIRLPESWICSRLLEVGSTRGDQITTKWLRCQRVSRASGRAAQVAAPPTSHPQNPAGSLPGTAGGIWGPCFGESVPKRIREKEWEQDLSFLSWFSSVRVSGALGTMRALWGH